MTSQEKLMPSDDRDRGILTPDDRKFLKGEKEYSNVQSERDARYRIRKRIKNGILDFSLLFAHLDKNDREQVFSNYNPPRKFRDEDEGFTSADVEDLFNSTTFANSISNTIAFLYLGVTDVGEDIIPIIKSAISDAEENRGYLVEDLTVKIEIGKTEPDTEILAKKFREGEPLSKEELGILVKSGEIEIEGTQLDEIFSQLASELTEEIDEGSVEIGFKSSDGTEGDQ